MSYQQSTWQCWQPVGWHCNFPLARAVSFSSSQDLWNSLLKYMVDTKNLAETEAQQKKSTEHCKKPIVREIRSWAKIIKESISKRFHIWLSHSSCSTTIHLWPYFVVCFFLIEAADQEIASIPRSNSCVQRSLNVNSIKTGCSPGVDRTLV